MNQYGRRLLLTRIGGKGSRRLRCPCLSCISAFQPMLDANVVLAHFGDMPESLVVEDDDKLGGSNVTK